MNQLCASCGQNPCKCPLKKDPQASLYGLRGYGLGERNPETLPGADRDSESPQTNVVRTRYWRSLGKKIRKGARVR